MSYLVLLVCGGERLDWNEAGRHTTDQLFILFYFRDLHRTKARD